MSRQKKNLVTHMDNNRKTLFKLCCSLIQAKSENPPGDVTEAAMVTKCFLEKNGLSTKTYEPIKGRMSLITTIGSGKKTLLFNGHIDVVPVGDTSRWSFHPLLGKVRGGKILGRGASDMKCGVAAILFALSELSRIEKDLNGKVVASVVCDEETGGEYGTKWLVEHGKLAGDACLIAETSGALGAGYAINAGERGVCWINLRAQGKPAHGSTPQLGKNAILAMMQTIANIQQIENTKVNIPNSAKSLVEEGKAFLSLIAKKNKVTNLAEALSHYSVNLGKIFGGNKVNVVPESCEAEVDIRIPVGGSGEAIKVFLQKTLPIGLSYKVLNFAAPSYTPAQAPLVKITKKAAMEFFNYMPPAQIIPATSDGHMLREKLGIPTISFGPGYAEKAHVYDEYVVAEDIVKFAKTYGGVALGFLGA
ncbi:MAG: ArgE/DapE family deacylase [Candidatus Bathyarchaeota archaeon]